MTAATPTTRTGSTRSRSLALHIAIVVSMLLATNAVAQSSPYQSAQRARVGTGLGQEAPPKGGYVEPRIDGAVQYADNINLAEQPKNQDNAFGLEVAPGIYASYITNSIQAAIDYSLIGRAWDDSSYDDISQILDANGRWEAVPELLRVEGDATYNDTVIDVNKGLNYGGMGIFGQSNLTEVATASVSPVLQKKFREVQFDASYRYGRVWYLNPGKSQTPVIGVATNDNSQDQDANVGIGTTREGRKLNGRIFYEWQKSTYDQALPFLNERAGFEGDFELSRTLRLVGDVGKESQLDKSTTAGGLGSDFWSAGLRWQPSDRTSAEGRFGERFFGSSYSGTISHRARFLDVTASYSEEPQVENRRLSLGQFDPGTLPPGVDPGTYLGRFNSQAYVAKDAHVAVSAKGSKTSLTLNVYDMQRNYLRNGFGDEHGTGASFDATRRLASNFSGEFLASYLDYQRDPSLTIVNPIFGSHDYDTQFIIRGKRDFGPRFSATVETGFLNRSGTSSYDGWWVALRGRWTPELN